MASEPNERILPAVAFLAAVAAAGLAGFVVGVNWRDGGGEAATVSAAVGDVDSLREEYERLAGDYRREIGLLEARRRKMETEGSERELLAEVRATLAKESAKLSREEVRVLRERLELFESLLEAARREGYLPTVKLPARGGQPGPAAAAPAAGEVDVMAVEEPPAEGTVRPELLPPPPDRGGHRQKEDND